MLIASKKRFQKVQNETKSQKRSFHLLWKSLAQRDLCKERPISCHYRPHLPTSAFCTLQLRELDIGQNLIESISEDAFVTLQKLEVLHLDANKLASVPSPTILRPLASTLQSLNLGQNAIQKLEAEVFLPLKNLKSLNLTGASIVNISLDAFRGLSGNTGPHSGLQILSLASNALDRFPNLGLLTHLERLYIGGNFIEKIEAHDLKGLSSLQVSITLPTYVSIITFDKVLQLAN